MAAVESGQVVEATTALSIASPADMKRDGTDELQASPANVSLVSSSEEEEDEELLVRSLQYDLTMRLIVAHQIQTLKLDMKKEIDICRSLLRDNDGESDRLRRRVLASLMAGESQSESDVDDDCTDVDGSEDEEMHQTVALMELRDMDEDEHQPVALREFRDMYAKASEVEQRFEELDDIMWAHYDPDLEDNEARKATVARLWRHLEKELDDRAEAVVSGAFNYTFAPLKPTHQSTTSSPSPI